MLAVLLKKVKLNIRQYTMYDKSIVWIVHRARWPFREEALCYVEVLNMYLFTTSFVLIV